MAGTLDNPPIILQQDQGKLAVVLVGSLLIAALSLWGVFAEGAFWSYAGLVLFGGGAMVLPWAIARPATLRIDQSGFALRSLTRTLQYGWEDVAEFFVWSPRRGAVKFPAFVYAEASKRDRIGRMMFGSIGSLGGCWELSPAEMVDILNRARIRWAPRN